ncbi:MAG: T9SS type A sorting domain-containing protein [Bacteroidetes bacterium]|nr:T9SS type A sorting domain-containing protein [Bacteroidota bacterium]
MKTRYTFWLLTLLLLPFFLNARVLEVGSGRAMTLPSQAAAAAQDGDTVLIDAGSYTDACRWTASDLLIRGVGGFAHVRDKTYGGKGIWVLQGNNTTVEWIEFSGATVPDKNGAGIRMEGTNLTLRHCFFHDNEDGILAGDNAASRILIEYCEFARNGYGDGYSHNMYINHIAEFTIRYSYIHHAKIGHNIKSRAYRTFIVCNGIANGDDGTASRDIDLPNGGLAVIAGNVIEHGPNTQNSNVCGYGMEGLTNPVRNLYVAHNTMTTARSAGLFIQTPASGCDTVMVINNLFAGRASIFGGSALMLDTAANLLLRDAAELRLADPAGFDYRPLADSPAIDAAIDAGSVEDIPLLPEMEYVHPAQATKRIIAGPPDIGALEYLPPVSVETTPSALSFDVDGPWPNPARGTAQLRVALRRDTPIQVEMIDLSGNVAVLLRRDAGNPGLQTVALDLRDVATGWYLCRIRAGNDVVYKSLIVW